MNETTATAKPDFFGTFTGFGQTRKTRKSAQREADAWNASGSGNRYEHQAIHHRPAHVETVVAEVQVVEGGFACAYLTTREPVEA